MSNEHSHMDLRSQAGVVLARLGEAQTGSLRVAGVGLALAGYALPLAFPAVALGLLLSLLGTAADSGPSGLSGRWVALTALAACTWMTLSLWRLRVADPGGEPIDERQAPALFEQIETLREAFQAAPVHAVHLTDVPALEIRRVPRNGYPFLVRQVLLIGLPALQCLSAEQFKCLLAARLAELSAVRADVAAWMTHLVHGWRDLEAAARGGRQPAALLYRAFLAGYLPLLAAIAQRLDDGRCLRRDRYTLEVASDDLVVEALAGEIVMRRFLDEQYWPTVYRAAEHSAEASFKVFRNLEPVFCKRLSDDRIQNWLREAYVGRWRAAANDPDLRTRLHELGHGELRYRRPDSMSAAQRLLGASHQWIIDRCDARWAAEHAGHWRALHEKGRRRHARMEDLRGRLESQGLRGEEAMEYAALVKRYGTADEARQAYRAVLAANPDDALINFGVGKFLLACDDAQGIRALEHAMGLDKRYVDPACRLISAFKVGQRGRSGREAAGGASGPAGR